MPIDSRHRSPEPKTPAQPYLDWAVATRFTYLREGPWLPVLVEFNRDEPSIRTGISTGQTPLQAFAELKWTGHEKESLINTIRIPDLLTNKAGILSAAKDFCLCAVLIHQDRAAAFLESPGWRRTILRAEVGPPVRLADSKDA
jgi:hypothetical protein